MAKRTLGKEIAKMLTEDLISEILVRLPVISLLRCSKLVLYNPAMGEYKPVPPRPFPCRIGWRHLVMGFGFGFVSNPDDYLVVSFVSVFEVIPDEYDNNNGESESDDDNDSDEDNSIEDDNDQDNIGDNINEAGQDDTIIKAEIYNLSANSWREIECNCPGSIEDRIGTQFNGALHWSACRNGIDIIISFDMKTELLHDMELPKDLMDKLGTTKSITVLKDSLALFAYAQCIFNTEQFIDIWVMKEYGVAESWTKHVSIGPLSGIRWPLMVWKDEAILLEGTNRQLISYALDTHEIYESEVQGVRGLLRLMVFQESLISLF